jgi:hypothetical protein
MGEREKQPFQFPFNASLKAGFQGSRVTSDDGLVLVRELDERLGFGELIAQHLTDSRKGKNCRFPRSSGSRSWARRSCSEPGPEGAPAFAKPEIYEAREKRGVKYAIRIPYNDSLERDISELSTRPVGRPGHKPLVWYKGFLYQAVSWKTARRVVAKVEFHFGELFPRVGFIVTNL